MPAEAVGRYRRVAANQVVPLRDTPRKGDAKREAAATDAWLSRSLNEAVRQMGAKPSTGSKENSRRPSVIQCCASGRRIPGPPWRRPCCDCPEHLRISRQRGGNCTAFALARARRRARRRRGEAYTGRRVDGRAADDARGRLFPRLCAYGLLSTCDNPVIARPTGVVGVVASMALRWRRVTLGANRTPSPRLGKNEKDRATT